jgi:hypothetical protein
MIKARVDDHKGEAPYAVRRVRKALVDVRLDRHS